MLMSFRNICSREKDGTRTRARWHTIGIGRKEKPQQYWYRYIIIYNTYIYDFQPKTIPCLCNFDGRQNEIWPMSVSSLRLGIFHHPQKSFRLDQKYFETFIILEYRLASVYRCCYGNFGAWNFANHVQKHKSYKIGERKMGCKRGRASGRVREREIFLCLPKPFFGNRNHINGKTTTVKLLWTWKFSYGWMLKMPFECRSRIACDLCPK